VVSFCLDLAGKLLIELAFEVVSFWPLTLGVRAFGLRVLGVEPDMTELRAYQQGYVQRAVISKHVVKQ
jgi:hypothetical protein